MTVRLLPALAPLLPLLLYLHVLRHAAARPVAALPDLQPVARAATWSDVNAAFRLVYNITSACPSVLTLSQPAVDERQVGQVPMSQISEDGFNCSGPSAMSIVTEATVRKSGLLRDIGLPAFRKALDANRKATDLTTALRTSGMLVGWHAGIRACRDVVHESSNIYFFIKEDGDLSFSLRVQNRMDEITFPGQQTALFVIPDSNHLCFYTDKSSNPSADVTLTSTSTTDGSVTTAVLTPAGLPAGLAQPSAPVAFSAAPATPSPLPPGVVVAPLPDQSALPASSAASSVNPGAPAPPSGIAGAPAPSGIAGTSPTAPAPAPVVSAAPSAVASPAPLGSGETSDSSDDEVASPDGVSDEDGVCFPGGAAVRLADGSSRRMDGVRIGDRVSCGGAADSPVVLFTHRMHGWFSFVRIVLVGRRVLTASRGHFVHASDGRLRTAGGIRPGDALVHAASGAPLRVLAVYDVCAHGLYNPQTACGSLVVNGLLVSCYTTAVEPVLAHTVLMAPVRTLFGISAWFVEWLSRCFDHGAPWLAALSPHAAPSYRSGLFS